MTTLSCLWLGRYHHLAMLRQGPPSCNKEISHHQSLAGLVSSCTEQLMSGQLLSMPQQGHFMVALVCIAHAYVDTCLQAIGFSKIECTLATYPGTCTCSKEL